MPWTRKQQDVARAVQHGWKPKGSAKGFTKSFAEQVIEESDDSGTLRHLGGMKRKKRKA